MRVVAVCSYPNGSDALEWRKWMMQDWGRWSGVVREGGVSMLWGWGPSLQHLGSW